MKAWHAAYRNILPLPELSEWTLLFKRKSNEVKRIYQETFKSFMEVAIVFSIVPDHSFKKQVTCDWLKSISTLLTLFHLGEGANLYNFIILPWETFLNNSITAEDITRKFFRLNLTLMGGILHIIVNSTKYANLKTM